MRNDFCIYILSHGRADRMHTIHTLERLGYTGNYYIIIDNEDETADQYFEKFGEEKVYQFDKRKMIKTFDVGDNFNNRNAVVFARNYCFQLAKKMKIKYFMQLDDDYTNFGLRFTKDGLFKHIHLNKSLDEILTAMIDYFDKCKNITCLAMAQDGDFIGGAGNVLGKNITMKRKAMNTMLCATNKPFNFLGLINEDVTAYVKHGLIGKLFFTISNLSVGQIQTQLNSGGLTDIYLDKGTYVKSFYTIMFCPSCVKIAKMGVAERRIHHKILWKYAVPKILREEHKKIF